MRHRLILILLCCLLLASASLPASADTAAGMPVQFSETGHTLAYNFRQFFESRGGVAVFGYPISEVFLENGMLVQYFERTRLEWHAPLARVQSGQLGRWLATGRDAEPAFQPVPAPAPTSFDGLYFAETGHTLSGFFLRYWRFFGQLDNFGYPISEPFEELDPATGETQLVQYFERARFELHPDQPLDARVQLTHLGRIYLAVNPPPASAILAPPDASAAWAGVRPSWVSIPRIGLDTAIEMGGFSYGTWDVPRYNAVFYWPVSGVPGTAGNIVLAGHVGYAGTIFNQLPQAQIGDLIYLTAGSGVHTYQITEIHTLLPHETWVMFPTPDETLTLITCVPINVYTHRLVVRAVPVS